MSLLKPLHRGGRPRGRRHLRRHILLRHVARRVRAHASPPQAPRALRLRTVAAGPQRRQHKLNHFFCLFIFSCRTVERAGGGCAGAQSSRAPRTTLTTNIFKQFLNNKAEDELPPSSPASLSCMMRRYGAREKDDASELPHSHTNGHPGTVFFFFVCFVRSSTVLQRHRRSPCVGSGSSRRTRRAARQCLESLNYAPRPRYSTFLNPKPFINLPI